MATQTAEKTLIIPDHPLFSAENRAPRRGWIFGWPGERRNAGRYATCPTNLEGRLPGTGVVTVGIPYRLLEAYVDEGKLASIYSPVYLNCEISTQLQVLDEDRVTVTGLTYLVGKITCPKEQPEITPENGLEAFLAAHPEIATFAQTLESNSDGASEISYTRRVNRKDRAEQLMREGVDAASATISAINAEARSEKRFNRWATPAATGGN